jgi:hypothetical protein
MISWPGGEIRQCVWQLGLGGRSAGAAEFASKPAPNSRFALPKVTAIDLSFLNKFKTGLKFYRCPAPLLWWQVRFSGLPTVLKMWITGN